MKFREKHLKKIPHGKSLLLPRLKVPNPKTPSIDLVVNYQLQRLVEPTFHHQHHPHLPLTPPPHPKKTVQLKKCGWEESKLFGCKKNSNLRGQKRNGMKWKLKQKKTLMLIPKIWIYFLFYKIFTQCLY